MRRYVVVKDIHLHPYGKNGRAMPSEGKPPTWYKEKYYRCAACGFPINLNRDTKCPACGSMVFLETPD